MSDDLPDGFLDRPATAFAAPYLRALEHDQAPAPDRLLGPWRILSEAGRGGMGTVYLAERADDSYHQQVALKVVRGWFTLDDHHLRRFRAERQILAALDHPNIARLLDGGVTTDGVPWFAMEFVAGLPIDQHARVHHLSVVQRLRLFLAACDAVQYAHQHLVVHRDLKPANLLVTADGRVKLLDFGVARLLRADEPGDAATLLTASRLMTPAYASPEQLRGDPIAVASDVYSLGVVLYLLLTGELPHRPGGLPPHELARAILEDVPPPASATARPVDRRQLRGNLDTILAVALRKEPSRRYPSVEAMADDVRRHLDGRPIAARAHSRGYLVGTFVRRHRLEVVSAALVITSLMTGIAAAWLQARRADQQRDLARLEASRAGEVATFLARVFRLADPNIALGDTVTVGAALDSAAVWLDREHIEHPEARADLALTLGGIFGARGRSADNRRMIDTALAIQERLYGPEDARLATTLTALAEAMRGEGKLAEAEPLLRRALALQRREPLSRARELDHTLNMLALSLRDQNRLTEAETLLHEALQISRRNAAEHPIGLQRTLTNLGHLFRAGGNASGAEQVHREVLQLRRAHWGPDHPEVANTLINLAVAVGQQRRPVEAESLFVVGLDMRRRLQGVGHREVGVDLAALAALYHRHGRLDVARSSYQEALAIQRATLAPSHPLLRATAESLAVVEREVRQPPPQDPPDERPRGRRR